MPTESILKQFYINNKKFKELKNILDNQKPENIPSKNYLQKGREKLSKFIFK